MTLAPIDEEPIDESCWIPEGEPVVQMDKNGMPWRKDFVVEFNDSGEMVLHQMQVRNIMNWLHERDRISDQNVFDGQTYERWQEVYRAKRSNQKIRNSARCIDNGGESLVEYGFLLILTRMPVKWQRLIDWAIDPTKYDPFTANRNSRHYHEAFERLTRLMPEIRSDVQRKLENTRGIAQCKIELDEKLKNQQNRF